MFDETYAANVRFATNTGRPSRRFARSANGSEEPLSRRGLPAETRDRPASLPVMPQLPAHATAEWLETTLEHMKMVEDMRRTLREIREANKLDPH